LLDAGVRSIWPRRVKKRRSNVQQEEHRLARDEHTTTLVDHLRGSCMLAPLDVVQRLRQRRCRIPLGMTVKQQLDPVTPPAVERRIDGQQHLDISLVIVNDFAWRGLDDRQAPVNVRSWIVRCAWLRCCLPRRLRRGNSGIVSFSAPGWGWSEYWVRPSGPTQR
jgi:hypothetical protein